MSARAVVSVPPLRTGRDQASAARRVRQELQVTEMGDAGGFELAGHGGADVGNQADRFGRRQGCGYLGIDHADAVRLASADGDLRPQLVRARPTEAMMPTSVFARLANRASTKAAAGVCTASVQHRFVDRPRLHQRCQLAHQRRMRDDAVCFTKSGLMKTASGQACNALNIGMALLHLGFGQPNKVL